VGSAGPSAACSCVLAGEHRGDRRPRVGAATSQIRSAAGQVQALVEQLDDIVGRIAVKLRGGH
jgi:hypothetical protein